MKYISLILIFSFCLLKIEFQAQSTRLYNFNMDSIHVFPTPSPINSFYLPYDIASVKKPMYAEPFCTDVSFPALAENIYSSAGNHPQTIFGGDTPYGYGWGHTAVPVIINDIFSVADFPIILEADFFNRSSDGSYNESYFWIGNSNYTHFNPSNSVQPTPNVQQGIAIGGLPGRSIISNGGSYLKTPVKLYDTNHNFSKYNEWATMKTILDVTEDGSLVIYNIFINGNCILTEPILVTKSDDLNLNSFKLAICVDDFAKEFKVTKNAILFQLPDVLACQNGEISLNADFGQELCLDFDYFWTLPGSDVGTSTLKNLSNVKYNTAGTFKSSLTLTNDFFSKVITFDVEVESSFTKELSIQLCTNDSIFFDNQWITKPGSYKEIITLQSGCDSTTVLEVTFSDSIKTYLDFFISPGDSIIVGQELYTAQGNYIQNLKSEVGCDSTLFITIKPINEDLLFDFNKCTAIVGTTNMDYSEFTSTFSQISCCKVAMSNIYRENPMENKHSCTPGLGNTLAMCVSSSSSYTYTAGSDKSVIFKFEVTPEEGKYFQINKLKFFEKSPLMFDWVNGGKGSNNYPTKFGFRVLKNGVEIFRDEAIISKRDWNERKIDFTNNEAFLVKEKAIYQFEFLPYCPIGNSATESVWDMENVSIFTSCLDKSSRILAGSVHDSEARPLVNVQVVKLQNEEIEDILTDEQGDFALTDGVNSDDCEISVLKSDDYLNGVSTLDLILMQRHILGLEDFDVARKYVAGDINLDTKVTASDIVALRKLILGITNKFGHEKSWRFVTDLPNFDKSSIIELNEHYFIEKGVKDLSGLDFTGIKIGDIDNDSNLAVNAENRNNYVEIIEYSIEKIGDNETNVHFYATSNLAINGLQVSLNPGDILNYEILDNQLSVERDQIHFTGENINIAYSSANSHVINTQKPLFTLKLRSKSSDKFRGLNSQFKNELYSSDLTKKNIHLNQRNNSNAFMIMSSKPNPFKGETLIEYSTNCSGPLRAEIYNITGTLIFSEPIIAEKGRNEFKITSNQLENKAGMYFLKLVSGTESRELKILMVN